MYTLLHLVDFNSKQEKSYSIFLTIYHMYVRNAILFCTGLTMIRFLFGNVIECLNDNVRFPQSYMDTKCYINGTLTKEEGHPILYHDYYQWVPVYLLLLAFGFNFPYLLWYKQYGNYLQYLEKLADKPEKLIQVIKHSKGNLIFLKTVALEFFYAVYLIFILLVTDVFFNELWSYFNWSWTAVYKIFPDNGACYFAYNQSGGNSENKLNCILPLCSIYRKIFLTLYFLVWALMIMNTWMILYRIILILHKKKCINIWWAFKIAEQCAASWDTKKQIKRELKEMRMNLKKVLSYNYTETEV